MTINPKNNVPYIETPLIHSKVLSSKTPCQIHLKQEFVQPSGSYKLRGLSHHIKVKLEEIRSDESSINKNVIVVAASGGNAGNAVSLSAMFYGLDSFIVVPRSTSVKMREKIEANGSTVIVEGANIGEADDYARNTLIPSFDESSVPIYCHPYNLPDIWEGHSTIIDEVAAKLTDTNQLENLKGIVCSIGGGGLYNGIVQGLVRNKLSHVPILTLETDSCPTFQRAIDSKKSVVLKSFNTIATSLACPYISPKSLENYQQHKTKNVLVSDSNAALSCLKFADDMGVIVEPACGVALCSIYDGIIEKCDGFFGDLDASDIIVIIVCGGSGTSFDDLSRYRQIYQL